MNTSPSGHWWLYHEWNRLHLSLPLSNQTCRHWSWLQLAWLDKVKTKPMNIKQMAFWSLWPCVSVWLCHCSFENVLHCLHWVVCLGEKCAENSHYGQDFVLYKHFVILLLKVCGHHHLLNRFWCWREFHGRDRCLSKTYFPYISCRR